MGVQLHSCRPFTCLYFIFVLLVNADNYFDDDIDYSLFLPKKRRGVICTERYERREDMWRTKERREELIKEKSEKGEKNLHVTQRACLSVSPQITVSSLYCK